MTLPVALALLSFAAPLTAAIISRSRKPENNAVSRREFDQLTRTVNRRFDDLQGDIRELRRYITARF